MGTFTHESSVNQNRLRSMLLRALALAATGVLCVSCTGHQESGSDVTGAGQTSHNGEVVQDEPNSGEDIAKASDPSDAPAPKDLPPLKINKPKPGKIGDQKEAASRAKTVVEAVLDVQNQVTARADGEVAGIEDITVGFVKGEIEALAAERSEMGVHQVGSAKIVSVEAGKIDDKAKYPTMELRVCLDLSDIDVIDEQGNSLDGLLYKPEHPVLNIYGAVFRDDQWKISTHTIPEDSSCKTETPEGN